MNVTRQPQPSQSQLPGNRATQLLRSRLDLITQSLEVPLATARWAPGFTAIAAKESNPVQRSLVCALEAPFDLALHNFGLAQRLGAIECSMITAQKFNRALAALERFTLGPWARR